MKLPHLHSEFSALPPYRLTRRDVRFFLSIMLPTLIELVLAHLFAMVDTMMLGNIPDSAPLIAAVGLTTSPVNLNINVVTSFCVGTTAAVAWFTGAGDNESARCAARQSMLLTSCAGVVVTAVSVTFADPIMRFAGANEDTLAFAVSYYRLIAAGFLIQIMTISITASLRGVGITKIPMLYNLSAAAINILLNYLLIYGKCGFPAMGIRGAALATTLSKIPAFLIALGMMLFGRLPIGFRRGDSFRPEPVIIRRILRIGVTAGLEQVLLQFGAILSVKIVAQVPTADFAANQIAANIDNLSWQPSCACAAASTTCMGQALGEGKPEKARAQIRMILFTSIGFGLMLSVLFITCGKPIAGLYTKDAALVSVAAQVLRVCAFSTPGIFVQVPISGALRGSGDTKTPLIASFISLWVFRVGLSYLLISVLGYGVLAARTAIVIDQTVRGMTVLVRYCMGGWVRRANRDLKTES